MLALVAVVVVTVLVLFAGGTGGDLSPNEPSKLGFGTMSEGGAA